VPGDRFEYPELAQREVQHNASSRVYREIDLIIMTKTILISDLPQPCEWPKLGWVL
jgi:hypothetical protein